MLERGVTSDAVMIRDLQTVLAALIAVIFIGGTRVAALVHAFWETKLIQRIRPLTDIAAHVHKPKGTVAGGRIRSDFGCHTFIKIRPCCVRLAVAPGIFRIQMPRSIMRRGVFPFIFRGQPAADPFAVLVGALQVHAVHRVVFDVALAAVAGAVVIA